MSPFKPQQPKAVTPPEEGLQPPWLMSFADFVSCLLACFVLLFSMVSLDKEKFQKTAQKLFQSAATADPFGDSPIAPKKD